MTATTNRRLHYQVRDLLFVRAGTLADLLGDPDLRLELERRVDQALPRILGELTGDDDRTAVGVVTDLAILEHGEDGEVPAEWWQTPLGRVAARVMDHDDTDAVNPTTAARMLGIAPSTVFQWRREGKLERHPDGGVTRASVMARLAEMRR